jgi:NitT/TauT family transport system permease protein
LFILYKNSNLFKHIYITIKETIIAFSITSILSLIISIILYNFKLLSKVIDPYLTILNSLPKVALGPIIILWCGANTKSIITMSVLISLIVSIQNIYTSFLSTNYNKIKLLKTFNASKKDILFYLVLPSNKSTILNTLKINISMCLIGVITGEFLTSKAGIGYLILYGSQIFNLDLVMSGIILLMIISTIMYKIITFISK